MAKVTGQPISPMLAVHDAAAAIAFYASAFDAVEAGDRHEWEGKIGHAEMEIGAGKIMISDEFPEYNTSPRTLGGTAVILHLEVDDVDTLTSQAKAAGAEIVSEPKTEPYGRISKVRDPFGHVWMLWASS